jgi:hypothetical protein
MLLLLGTLLQLLILVNLSACKENLLPSATIFFYDIEYHYDIILEKLNLQTLHIRCRRIDALFLINAFCGIKHCPSVLETVGIRVPTQNIRNFTTFSCSFSHCPSARCVSSTNAVWKLIDIFSKSHLSLNSLSWFTRIFLCFLSVSVVVFCPVLSYCCFLYSCWVCNWHWLLTSAR